MEGIHELCPICRRSDHPLTVGHGPAGPGKASAHSQSEAITIYFSDIPAHTIQLVTPGGATIYIILNFHHNTSYIKNTFLVQLLDSAEQASLIQMQHLKGLSRAPHACYLLGEN